MTRSVTCLASLLCLLGQTVAFGHAGRRFEILVDSTTDSPSDPEQLIAQGINTGQDDGFPAVRPYTNVIHDHWIHSEQPNGNQAFARLPGFDLPSPDPRIHGKELVLSLVGASKWANPPMMPTPDTVPALVDLDADETIFISRLGQGINTSQLGSMTLLNSIPAPGASDLDLRYEISKLPAGSIYVLELMLSARPVTTLNSDRVYVLIGPDGANHAERLHHASLHLESYLGAAATPEPSAGLLGMIGSLVLAAYLRRREAV